MPQSRPHMNLGECRPCVVLKQDTFAGVLTTAGVNNVQLQVSAPIAYFKALQKELDDKLHQRGIKGSYIVNIKVNPKDHKSFVSASFKYGRRLLTFTNVSSLARVRTKETTSYCVEETTVTATRIIRPAGSPQQWVTEHEAAWKKSGYKGKFTIWDGPNGTIWNGNFEHTKEDKKVKVTTKRKSKRSLYFVIEQTVKTYKNIRSKDNPKIWAKEIDRQMKKDKFDGSIETYINSWNKTVINGRYTKTVKDKNTVYNYLVQYSNQTEKVSSAPIVDIESWRPTKKVGKHVLQVRSIAQDDTYTPEFRGKQPNWDRIEIDKLYKEYMQMPQKELEIGLQRFESMNERAATKGQKAALKWLRHVRNSKPQWLKAPNAYNLALYCIKYIEREIMTPSEASFFCKNHAYNNKPL